MRRQRIEFRAMNCRMLAMVDAEAQAASDALQDVPMWFVGWEQCLSRFIGTSELSQLNATHNGQWVRVGSVLWDVLQCAARASDISAGLVSPLVGAMLEAAGYDRTFDAIRSGAQEPDAAFVGCALPHAGHKSVAHLAECNVTNGEGRYGSPCGPFRASPTPIGPVSAQLARNLVSLHRSDQAVRLPLGAKLDVGGVAKGWAAHEAMRRLQAFGPALVDAGGDIAVSARANGEPWPIDIAHPLCNGDDVRELVCVPSGGVATSGRDYRRWRTANDDCDQHHIIDVRTGRPAETDVLSATVIAPDVMLAEAAAKTMLILGGEAGMHWLEARSTLAGLLVLDDGRVRHSHRLGAYLWREEVTDGFK